jgi:hypothetical protein
MDEKSLLVPSAGERFGRLMVLREVERSGNHRYFETVCTSCQSIKRHSMDSLKRATAGCRACSNPRVAPKWLVARCSAAKDRCTNPRNRAFHNYGGRGIRFEFKSPTVMALWIMANLNVDRTKQIDRIDNNSGYRPGNIRLTTARINVLNNRSPNTIRMHQFRLAYPHVRYADLTILRLFSMGLSPKEIAMRFQKPSCKPKGRYGTFSTPDRDIASLLPV